MWEFVDEQSRIAVQDEAYWNYVVPLASKRKEQTEVTADARQKCGRQAKAKPVQRETS